MNRRTAMLILDDASLHKNISKLLSKLSEMTEHKEAQLNYDPVSVSKKLDGTAPFVFVDMIKTYVRYYFATIDSIMKDLARQNLYNDNLIRAQIRMLSFLWKRKEFLHKRFLIIWLDGFKI